MSRTRRSIGAKHLTAALLCLWLGACVSDPTAAVTQFGKAVGTTAASESGLFSPALQRAGDVQRLCILMAPKVDVSGTGQLTPVGSPCATLAQSDMQQAADGAVQALQAYATALQAAVSDTPATTFNTNIDALGKSVGQVGTALQAPGVKGGPTPTEITAVGVVVKDIGDVLINFAKTRVIKDAAQQMQTPLHQMANHLGNINSRWTAGDIAGALRSQLANNVIVLWQRGSISDRQMLLTAYSADSGASPSAAAVNNALAAVATANDKIATAGPASSTAEIQTAIQAANDALAAVNAIKGGK
jgi:hypothetical protein